MKGLFDLLSELAVSLHCHKDLRGLYADLEVLKVMAVEDVDIAQG